MHDPKACLGPDGIDNSFCQTNSDIEARCAEGYDEPEISPTSNELSNNYFYCYESGKERYPTKMS